LRAGGHEAVTCVLAMAPWLPDEDVAAPAEPVKQLVGRRVLIVHGTNDERIDPELSFRLAARAKKANRDVCRFEAHSDRHGLHQYRDEVLALAEDFVMGALFGRAFSRPVEDALAAPPPLGLRMPLAVGFGSTLRR
jgi:predicted esterase